MSRIRSKNTKAELIVFRYLRNRGVYIQKHYSRAPGKPDIALPRKKKAVFIDGDFWHGRGLNRLKERNGDNAEYWIAKIQRNIERDLEQQSNLDRLGWNYIRIWESDIKRKSTRQKALEDIELFLITDIVNAELPYCGFWQATQNSGNS